MAIVKYEGKDIVADEVDVINGNEPWNEYQLANGDVLMIKTVLIRAMKGRDIKTPQGDSLYLVNTQCIVKAKMAGGGDNSKVK